MKIRWLYQSHADLWKGFCVSYPYDCNDPRKILKVHGIDRRLPIKRGSFKQTLYEGFPLQGSVPLKYLSIYPANFFHLGERIIFLLAWDEIRKRKEMLDPQLKMWGGSYPYLI